MSLETILKGLADDLAADNDTFKIQLYGSVDGSLADLNTTNKTSFVAALNETRAAATGSPPDASESVKGVLYLGSLAEHATGTNSTKAATIAGVRQERTALKAEILGGVGPAFDTLSELLAEAQEDQPTLAALVTTVGGKADASNVYTKAQIDTMLGDLTFDLAAYYQAAKA